MNYKNIILIFDSKINNRSKQKLDFIRNIPLYCPCQKHAYKTIDEYNEIIYKYSSITAPKIMISVDTTSFFDTISKKEMTCDLHESHANQFKYTRINYNTHLVELAPICDSYSQLEDYINSYFTINNDISALKLSESIGKQLTKLHFTISSAESCSGGLIAKRFTDISGSSHYFNGGICTYTAQAKSSILHIPMSDIQYYGIVSTQTAQSMANGAQELFNTNVALATTGVAGPGPDDDHNPEGLVCIAIKINHVSYTFRYCASKYSFFLDRNTIRNGCVLYCLQQLSQLLNAL